MTRFAFLLISLIVVLGSRPGLAETAQAPFGDKVSAAIVNYDRASPVIGTAGLLKGNGVAEAKALGFKTIVDLRGPDEGTAAERAAAKAAGIAYIGIPVTTKAPAPAQVPTFAKIVEDPDNWPILVHCVSANRVGAMWALYRASRGVPAEVAIEEGRATGLRGSREAAVRQQLGLTAQN